MADTAVKHTPGPWTATLYDEDFHTIETSAGVAVAEGYNKADARLIAAAPDLLEALCNVLSYVPHGDMPVTIYDNARAAIAKAEGKA
jgi:hypothetical protein